MCVIKRKIKFEIFKSSFEATQLDKTINSLEKMKLTYIVLKSNKELIKNNKQ